MPHARRKPLGQGVQALGSSGSWMWRRSALVSDSKALAPPARPSARHRRHRLRARPGPAARSAAAIGGPLRRACRTAHAALAHDRAAHATTQPVRIEQLIEPAPVALAGAQQSRRAQRSGSGAQRPRPRRRGPRPPPHAGPARTVVAQQANEADEAPGQRRCRCLRQRRHATLPSSRSTTSRGTAR